MDLANTDVKKCFNTDTRPGYKNLPVDTVTGKVLHIIPTNSELSTNRVDFATTYIREKCMFTLLQQGTDEEIQQLLVGLDGGSLRGSNI